MRLPDFLIIGAMKAGTTTLFRDLGANPAIFMPHVKEPGNLAREDVLTAGGRRAYAALFEGARPGQRCGEASTNYSKLPDHPGVAPRARELLGGGLKVIYLVREPVARIISQHHHERASGRTRCEIDEAVRTINRYLDYTRYATQVEPWLDALGRQNVFVERFETYVRRRRETVAAICRFLGVEPSHEAVRDDRVHNRSAGKPVSRGPVAAMMRSGFYRRVVRPRLSHGLRERIRRVLLPKAPAAARPPATETVAWILDELAGEMERLRAILGRADPLWDFEEIRLRYGAAAAER